ncbi:unnamed protein product [Phytophthora fragariaefolia]|uniref:Unnamed protein product n=1 Tax=Phytophthora fragariaefolia TaxID=1490495 RepID=A0A9W6YQG6_9STRA|nr:unnamed protein product [Phytophthora fragariaefolia]
MREPGRRQVQSQVVHRLSLRFVDGHSERRLDRELLASQLVGKAGVVPVAYEHDSWNQHVLSAALPGHDLGVDDIGLELHHPKSSTVTKSQLRVQVAHEHDRRSLLERQLVRWDMKKVVLGSCTWKLVLDTAEAWSEAREGT